MLHEGLAALRELGPKLWRRAHETRVRAAGDGSLDPLHLALSEAAWLVQDAATLAATDDTNTRTGKIIEAAAAGGDSVMKPRTLPASTDESAGPALTANQSRVLQTMAQFDPSQLVSADAIAAEMDAAGRLSARTIGPIVRKLIELRFAERPQGERSGARLTTAGRRLASKTAD